MTTHDEIVLQLEAKIKQKKEEISKAEKPFWKTNLAFSYFDGGPVENLHTVTDIPTLVKYLAWIIQQHDTYIETCKKLNITSKFTFRDYTLDQWSSDIQTKINRIQISEKKKQLTVLENRLNAIMSPDLRAKIEIEKIKAELEL
jgi:hypothetical protein